jgi:hypothetical protein
MKLAAFSEHELKTTSNALRSNLGANDLTIWMRWMQHLSGK